MRALARLAVAVAGLLLILSLVVTITTTTTSEVVPARGGVYSEGLPGTAGRLNPLASTSQPDSDIAALVFSGLTRRDQDGRLAPDVAESWQVSADARVITFTLKTDRRWHDGEPVTTDDVIYTVKALQGDAFGAAAWLKALWHGVRAEKVGDRGVQLTLPEPYAPFVQYTAIGLLPAHVLATGDEAAKESYDGHPIGTGPYRLISRSSARTVLEAVSADIPAAPMIPRLEFRYYVDQQAALAALKNGEVMAVGGVSPAQGAELSATPGMNVLWAPSAGQVQVVFNLSLPFFEDADTRRALMLSVDRRGLVASILGGKAIVSDGPFLSTSWATAAPPAPREASPETARVILAQAGWEDENRDGVVERNGVPLAFGLLTSDDPTRVAVATAVARAWTSLGAAVEVQVINTASMLTDYVQARRFEALLIGWGNIPDDPDPYEMWHSSQNNPTGLNLTGFSSQTVDEMLEQARGSGDPATRRAIYARFEAMINEQTPAFVLYEPMYGFAVSGKLKAVRVSFIANPGDRFRHIGEWYTLTRTITSTERQRLR